HPPPELRSRSREVAGERERDGCRAQRLERVLAVRARPEVPLEFQHLAGIERVQGEARDLLVHHKKYGARRRAPSAYQTPKRRLNAPSAGAIRENERRAGSLESVSPRPVDSTAIEIAVKKAKRPSARTATRRSWMAASSSTPTPALPPIPCTSPIPNAWSGERARTVWRCS